MRQNQISMRQLMVLFVTGMLSPAIRVLPTETAAVGGAGGWLSTLIAIPAALALFVVIGGIFRRLPPHTGLAQGAELMLGKPLGKVVTAVLLLWGLFLLAVNVRLSGLRFLSMAYRNGPLLLFIGVLLGVVVWICGKGLPALVRTGEICYLVLVAVLAFVLLLSIPQVEIENLLPIWVEDLPSIGESVWPAVALLGYVVYGALLMGQVTPQHGNLRRAMGWMTAWCVLMSVVQLLCIGNFGWALTAEMDTPFFIMSRGIGIQGAFERVEAVVVALWVLSDICFLGLMVFATGRAAQSLFGREEMGKLHWPVGLVALFGAIFLLEDGEILATITGIILPLGNILLGFGLPVLMLVVAVLRKGVYLVDEKGEKGHI